MHDLPLLMILLLSNPSWPDAPAPKETPAAQKQQAKKVADNAGRAGKPGDPVITETRDTQGRKRIHATYPHK